MKKVKEFKIVSLFGIRSDIIKFSPLFSLLDKNFIHIMVHSNQHYDHNMDKIFFDDLKLRLPDYNINSGSASHAVQASKIMCGFEQILLNEKPDAVIIQGDTNTTISGAIVSVKLNIPLIHVEGGCRGFVKNEPEEINRKVADCVSDLIFAPDELSMENLTKEGFSKEKIFLSGNTSLDVCLRNVKLTKNDICKKYNVIKRKFILVTIHRTQNTQDRNRLQNIITALEKLGSDIQVIFPVHPRTKKAFKTLNIKLGNNIKYIEPISYIDFLGLMKNAKIIITDSASIQEESVFLNIPCLVAYNETPWVTYTLSGKNKLVGYDKDNIIKEASKLLFDKKYYKKIQKIPYCIYNNVSTKIVNKIISWLEEHQRS